MGVVFDRYQSVISSRDIDDFIWTTADGRKIPLYDMEDSHLQATESFILGFSKTYKVSEFWRMETRWKEFLIIHYEREKRGLPINPVRDSEALRSKMAEVLSKYEPVPLCK